MEELSKVSDKKLNLIAGISISAVILVILPLLILGFYNYPMADDWSMGIFVHKAVTTHEASIFKAAADGIHYWYTTGEPRFSSILFGVLAPSALGNDHMYYVVSFIMIFGLIFCQLFFYNSIIRNIRLSIIVTAVPTALQLLCVPFPTETFYWYVGAVNYTFINALSLILIVLFFSISHFDSNTEKRTKIITYFFGLFLAVLVGGNNFGTSLSRTCLFCFLSLMFLLHDRKKLLKTLPITLTMLFCLIICLISPGSEQRLNGEYANAGFSAPVAVWKAIHHTASAILTYTDLKILLTLLLILPFLAYGLKKYGSQRLDFRFPGIFTLISFLLYASELVPNYYVEGSVRAQRMADIFYYEYYLFILLNTIYWTGWFVSKQKKESELLQKFAEKYALKYFVILSVCILSVFSLKNLRQSSSYRAAVWLVRGYAAEYKAAWTDRLSQLNDPSLREVFFEPIDLNYELVFYADLTEDPDGWLNLKCAEYYGKDAVGIIHHED